MKKIVLLLLAFAYTFHGLSQESSVLVVKIENIKEVKGSLRIALYNHEDHFLTKEVASDGRAIQDESITFSFEGLESGTYAVSIFHDENNNGKLDSNIMGIPSEPYAFSNNAKGLFGPPSFEDCKFEINGSEKEIIITL